MNSPSAISTLASANSYISLALELGTISIPLVKGLISEIKQIGSGGGTVTYQIVLTTDEAANAETVSVSIADLVAINNELTRLKQVPLAVPAAPAT